MTALVYNVTVTARLGVRVFVHSYGVHVRSVMTVLSIKARPGRDHLVLPSLPRLLSRVTRVTRVRVNDNVIFSPPL